MLDRVVILAEPEPQTLSQTGKLYFQMQVPRKTWKPNVVILSSWASLVHSYLSDHQ